MSSERLSAEEERAKRLLVRWMLNEPMTIPEAAPFVGVTRVTVHRRMASIEPCGVRSGTRYFLPSQYRVGCHGIAPQEATFHHHAVLLRCALGLDAETERRSRSSEERKRAADIEERRRDIIATCDPVHHFRTRWRQGKPLAAKEAATLFEKDGARIWKAMRTAPYTRIRNGRRYHLPETFREHAPGMLTSPPEPGLRSRTRWAAWVMDEPLSAKEIGGLLGKGAATVHHRIAVAGAPRRRLRGGHLYVRSEIAHVFGHDSPWAFEGVRS